MTYEEALAIAEEAFKGKKDRGGSPYILHCKRVAARVCIEYKPVAILHDLLEDCPEWTEQRLLEEGLDSKLLDTLKLLTHNKKEDSYEEYIDKISKDRNAIFIKVRDLQDNMSVHRLKKITDKDVERLRKYNKAFHKLINVIVNRNA